LALADREQTSLPDASGMAAGNGPPAEDTTAANADAKPWTGAPRPPADPS